MSLRPTLVGLLLGLCVTTAVAAPYSFTKISDSTGPYSSYIDASINNLGFASIFGNLDVGGVRISTGNGGSLTTIANSTGAYVGLGRPSIGDDNWVSFLAANSGGGLTVEHGNGFQDVPLGPGPGTPVALGNSSAWITGPQILLGDGNPLFPPTILYSTGPVFSGFGSNELDYSSAGVAFFANRTAGGFGIFKGLGGPTTTIADSTTFSGFGTPAINSGGKVAFVGVRPTLPKGIFTGNGGAVSTYVDTSGAFSDFIVEMDINDVGTVAFLGLLDAGGGGIFTGPNPVTDKMLVTGDSLFGSTITDLGLSFGSLNNAGQISFVYSLANGITGVAVATPVPEPSLLVPLLLAAGAVGFGRSKRP